MDTPLSRLKATLHEPAVITRFSDYLRVHFEEFSEAIASFGADKWNKIAEWAHGEGFTGKRRISAAAAEKAFLKEKDRRSVD